MCLFSIFLFFRYAFWDNLGFWILLLTCVLYFFSTSSYLGITGALLKPISLSFSWTYSSIIWESNINRVDLLFYIPVCFFVFLLNALILDYLHVSGDFVAKKNNIFFWIKDSFVTFIIFLFLFIASFIFTLFCYLFQFQVYNIQIFYFLLFNTILLFIYFILLLFIGLRKKRKFSIFVKNEFAYWIVDGLLLLSPILLYLFK